MKLFYTEFIKLKNTFALWLTGFMFCRGDVGEQSLFV